MRWLMTVGLFMGAVMALHADTFVYVSMTPEKKIQIFRMDPADGKLTSIESLAVDGNPGALGVDPEQKYLFASLRAGGIASYRIDPGSGKLTLLSSVPLPKGEAATFVGTDRTGRWLIAPSYSGGKVTVYAVNADGTIKTPPLQVIPTAKTAHSFATDPKNEWVFVPHVNPNAVYQFRLDAATGKLTEASQAPGGADGAGPRHIAFYAPLSMAYTSNELGNSITAYSFNASTGLKPVQTLSTLPVDFKGKNTTAEVKVHPNGKFVWVSNRGHDSLAGFSIDAKTGMLKSLGQTPTEKTPRSFNVEPDGRFLFAAGEGSGKLAAYRVDGATGALARIGTYDVGKSLGWVMAVKFPGK